MAIEKETRDMSRTYITEENLKELEDRVWKASGMFKSLLALPNNVAYIMLYNAQDHIRRHPKFRQEAKRAFNQAMDEYRAYEKRLHSATTNRMFHLADLTDDARKRFGDITDKDYFELWQDMGSRGYELAKPHLLALTHKFRKQLRARGDEHADILCHVLTAQAVIDIAITYYQSAVKLARDEMHVPVQIIPTLYQQFSLDRVGKALDKSLRLIGGEYHPLNELEEKDITISIRDISEVWAEQDNILEAMIDTIENNEEIFRTKGEMKKLLKVCVDELNEE